MSSSWFFMSNRAGPEGGGRGISTTLILINIMFHFRDFSATYIWVIFPMMISKRVRKVLYWKLRCVCVCVCVWIHLCCIMFNLYILCFMLEYCGLYRCFGKILLTHRCIYEFSLIFTPHIEKLSYSPSFLLSFQVLNSKVVVLKTSDVSPVLWWVDWGCHFLGIFFKIYISFVLLYNVKL